MRLQEAMEKATKGELVIGDMLLYDDLPVTNDTGESWRYSARRLATPSDVMVAEVSGSTPHGLGYPLAEANQVAANAALLTHWWNHGPKLLEALSDIQDEPDYDAGLLSDFGRGNVNWWHDYIRAEIGRCNDYWREQIACGAIIAEAEEVQGI